MAFYADSLKEKKQSPHETPPAGTGKGGALGEREEMFVKEGDTRAKAAARSG